MSNKILNLVRDARLGDPTMKEVLKAIADQSNDAGTGVWSSYAYIAWCIERGRSTVIDKCMAMKKKGVLSWTRGHTNRFQINVAELRKYIVAWSVCEVCDGTEGVVTDHWIPRSKGGKDDYSNKVRLCVFCNSEKSDIMPEVWLQDKPDVYQRVTGRLRGEPQEVQTVDSKVQTADEEVQTLDPSPLEPLEEPKEHVVVFHAVLEVWKEKFPKKRQPQPTNVKLQRKVKARLKVPSFKERLWAALLYAENSPSLMEDSWFQLEYLLRNDDNYEKVASGEFDWKDEGKLEQDAETTRRKATADHGGDLEAFKKTNPGGT